MSYIGSYIWQVRESGWGKRCLLTSGINAFVLNEKDEILLGLREDFKGGPSWCTPGGTMEPGQSILDTLHREIKEELGQDIIEANLFGIASGPQYTSTYATGNINQSLAVLFEIRLAGEPVNGEKEEHAELRFFPLNALPENLHTLVLNILPLYVAWKQTGKVQLG